MVSGKQEMMDLVKDWKKIRKCHNVTIMTVLKKWLEENNVIHRHHTATPIKIIYKRYTVTCIEYIFSNIRDWGCSDFQNGRIPESELYRLVKVYKRYKPRVETYHSYVYPVAKGLLLFPWWYGIVLKSHRLLSNLVRTIFSIVHKLFRIAPFKP